MSLDPGSLDGIGQRDAKKKTSREGDIRRIVMKMACEIMDWI